MNPHYDYIVVGTGPAGVHAAQTLLEAGKTIMVMDGGEEREDPIHVENDFFQIRRTDPGQYRLFLGENFEALNFEEQVLQLTPSRSYLVNDLSEKILSSTFNPLQSISHGGLGNAWGLGINTFTAEELKLCGLPEPEIQDAYQVIADRIGISYSNDDIAEHSTASLRNIQPAIEVDHNASSVLSRYNSRKNFFNRRGFSLGKPSLAILTQPKDGRSATSYSNLDFYGNPGSSAWRPDVTWNKIRNETCLKYLPNSLLVKFKEEDNNITATIRDTKTKSVSEISAGKMILAANVLGNAGIISRSYGRKIRFPVLCNPFVHLPMVIRKSKPDFNPRTSTAQLMMFYDPEGTKQHISMASLYSYSSLLYSRLIRQSPFNARDSLHILRWLGPRMMIAGIYVPDSYSAEKFIEMDEVGKATYHLSTDETTILRQTVKSFRKAFDSLGCFTLNPVFRPHGSSFHYGGCLPYDKRDEQFYLERTGRLAGSKNIYVADASGFCFLPAKGPTFTIMANAHRTALNSVKNE